MAVSSVRTSEWKRREYARGVETKKGREQRASFVRTVASQPPPLPESDVLAADENATVDGPLRVALAAAIKAVSDWYKVEPPLDVQTIVSALLTSYDDDYACDLGTMRGRDVTTSRVFAHVAYLKLGVEREVEGSLARRIALVLLNQK